MSDEASAITEERALFDSGLGSKAIDQVFEAVDSWSKALQHTTETTFLGNYNQARVDAMSSNIPLDQPAVTKAVKGWLMEEFLRQFEQRNAAAVTRLDEMLQALEKPPLREVNRLRYLEVGRLQLIAGAASSNLGEDLQLNPRLATFQKYGLQKLREQA